MHRSSSLAVLLLVALAALNHAWVSHRQPAPYMDELFHIPQAERFCAALAAWNSSLIQYNGAITTPPGPYLAPALLGILSPYFCTAAGMRCLSAVFIVLSFLEARCILRSFSQRQPSCVNELTSSEVGHDARELQLSLKALLIVLHPVLFFYSNLFYTDPLAVFFLLLCFRLALQKSHWLSAIAGIASVLCRQTGALFHAYIAVDSLLASIAVREGRAWHSLARISAPHAVAGAIYVALFAANSFSVALGDQEHHGLSAHFAMLAYHTGFCLLAGLPIILASGALTRPGLQKALLRTLCTYSKIRLLTAFTLACVLPALCVVLSGAFVHPFVLADNRHFTFYLYRRIILRSPWVRLSPVPLYALGLLVPFLHTHALCRVAAASLRQVKHAAEREPSLRDLGSWCLSEMVNDFCLLFITSVCVIPATLLEPRYFVPGFLLTGLRTISRLKLVRLEGIFSILLLILANHFLLHIFCERPFPRDVDPHMPQDLSPGRFMF